MDYYTEKINEIKKLINNQEYDEALIILKSELSMPYIPMDCEKIFNDLLQEVNSYRDEKNINRRCIYDKEQVLQLLNGELSDAYIAIEFLKESNIRNYLDVVEAYLSVNPDKMIRAALIEILVDQQIHDEINLDYDGMEVRFIPSYVEKPFESDNGLKCVSIIENWFINDNPSFMKLCIETLFLELSYLLPFQVDEDEIMMVCKAVVKYVYKASNDEEQFYQFESEKKLANYGDYDLLLYKYNK